MLRLRVFMVEALRSFLQDITYTKRLLMLHYNGPMGPRPLTALYSITVFQLGYRMAEDILDLSRCAGQRHIPLSAMDAAHLTRQPV